MSTIKFTYTIYGETNQGLVRKNNEDAFICQTIWDDNHILCAAIDGLGGYEGGEIASEIVRAGIIKHLEDFASVKPGQLLKDAMIDVNNEIESQHKVRPKASQMGCVASVALFDLEKDIVYVAHCGDSRIYEYANGVLKKLTHDHSLVGYREETGEMTEDAAMHHPKRNVIDRYLGEQHLQFNVEDYIEVSAFPISGEAQYLFCSDGLTDLITSKQIVEVLNSSDSVEKKAQELIAGANSAGGKDNVTVVLVDLKSADNPSEEIEKEDNDFEIKKVQPKKKGSAIKNLLLILSGLIIGAGVTYWGVYCMNAKTETITSQQIIKITEKNEQLTDTISALKSEIKKLTETINLSNTNNNDSQESNSSL